MGRRDPQWRLDALAFENFQRRSQLFLLNASRQAGKLAALCNTYHSRIAGDEYVLPAMHPNRPIARLPFADAVPKTQIWLRYLKVRIAIIRDHGQDRIYPALQKKFFQA